MSFRIFSSRVSYLLGIVCVFVGIFLLIKRFGLVSYSFPDYQISSINQTDKNLPKRIIVDRLNINLAVEAKEIISKRWPLSDTGAIYLKGSGLPGKAGNVVIYGHNWPQLLGNLKKIKVGDEIILRLDDGHSFTYHAQYVAVVGSDQTHVLNHTSDHRLTLYTCTGLLDQKRFVVVATESNAPIK